MEPTTAPLPHRKPGILEATAILALVSGALHVVGFLALLWWILVAGFFSFGIACFLLPLVFFPLVMAIVEIRYGLDLFPDPIRRTEPNKVLAIVQICLILFGNVVAVAAGIVALVAYSDEDVVRCFEEARRARGTT